MGTEAPGLEEGQHQGIWWVVKVDIIVNWKTKDKQICDLVLVDELQAGLADGDTSLVVYLKEVWFKIKKTKPKKNTQVLCPAPVILPHRPLLWEYLMTCKL